MWFDDEHDQHRCSCFVARRVVWCSSRRGARGEGGGARDDDEDLKKAIEASELAELAVWPDLPRALHASAVETEPEPWVLQWLVGAYMYVEWTSTFHCMPKSEEDRQLRHRAGRW